MGDAEGTGDGDSTGEGGVVGKVAVDDSMGEGEVVGKVVEGIAGFSLVERSELIQ